MIGTAEPQRRRQEHAIAKVLLHRFRDGRHFDRVDEQRQVMPMLLARAERNQYRRFFIERREGGPFLFMPEHDVNRRDSSRAFKDYVCSASGGGEKARRGPLTAMYKHTAASVTIIHPRSGCTLFRKSSILGQSFFPLKAP